MTNIDLSKQLELNPLVVALTDKTKEGKLKWEPTSVENTFIASVGGGTTLRLSLAEEWDIDEYGHEGSISVPELELLGDKGQVIWIVKSNQVKAGLWALFNFARRIAYKVDERVADLLKSIEQL